MTNQDWCSRWYRISVTAQFSLYNSKGTKIKTISLKDSDTDVTAKTAKITGLDPGKYTLKETYACRGCVINETTFCIVDYIFVSASVSPRLKMGVLDARIL